MRNVPAVRLRTWLFLLLLPCLICGCDPGGVGMSIGVMRDGMYQRKARGEKFFVFKLYQPDAAATGAEKTACRSGG